MINYCHGVYMILLSIYCLLFLSCRSTRGQDALLLRGAVFYISMSMWGINRVETLGLSFASVLPSLKQVNSCSDDIDKNYCQCPYRLFSLGTQLLCTRSPSLSVVW